MIAKKRVCVVFCFSTMNPSATAVVCVLFLLVGVIAFTDTSGSSGSTDAASLQSLISSVVFTPAGSVGTLSLLIGLALPLLFHLKSRSANDAPNDAHYKNVRSAIESLPLPCDNAAEVIMKDMKKLHILLENWANEAGDFYRLDIGPKPVIVASNLDFLRKATLQRPMSWRHSSDLPELSKETHFDGLFSAEGLDWKRHRNITAKSFNLPNVRAMMPALAGVSKRLEGRWRALIQRGENNLSMKEEMTKFTMEVIFVAGFGRNMPLLAKTTKEEQEYAHNRQVASNFFEIFNIGQRRILSAQNPTWRTNPTEQDKEDQEKIDANGKFIRSMVSETVEAERQRLEQGQEDESSANLMKAMIASNLDPDMVKKGKTLSLEELVGNTNLFVGAGHETTSNTLSWTIFELCKQDRASQLKMLHEEVDRVFPDINSVVEDMEWATIHEQLPVCEATFKEALRLHTVAPMVWFMYGVNSHKEEYFSKPNEFRPERWIPQLREVAADLPVHREEAWIPFGNGPRICAGMKLARIETIIAIAFMFRVFKFTLLCPEEDVEEVNHITVSPSQLPVRVELRGT